MNKEKEIEEMASIIYSKLNTGTYDNAFDDVGDAVVALQEAGYRKADEVGKETAKDILQGIYELCKERGKIQFDDVFYWVMKYGVEVEE